MTWWIAAYFILYCGLFLFSLWDDIVTDEPLWYVAMDGLADVAAILFILGRAYMPAEA